MPKAESDFLCRVKRAVLDAEPAAEVYLYGSRARGEALPESDWDLLILLNGPVTEAQKQSIRQRLLEIEWEMGATVSPFFRAREEWFGEGVRWTPFRENVRREAVPL